MDDQTQFIRTIWTEQYAQGLCLHLLETVLIGYFEAIYTKPSNLLAGPNGHPVNLFTNFLIHFNPLQLFNTALHNFLHFLTQLNVQIRF